MMAAPLDVNVRQHINKTKGIHTDDWKIISLNSLIMKTKAKPFIKWVGGKGQLIEQLEAKLPADFDNWDDATYIEPFVGGGAMLFY